VLPLDIATSDPRELAEWLGLPSGASWIRLRTERPIGAPGNDDAFLTEEPSGPGRLPFNARQLKGWRGLDVILFGALVITGKPPEGDSWPYWGFAGAAWVQLRCAYLWEPGSPVRAEAAWSYHHGDLEYIRFGSGRPTPGQLARAGEAIQLLRGLAQRGMSNEEAFAEAVRFGLEWLEDHPNNLTRDLRSHHLAARKVIEPKSYEKWMGDKHFGIKAVRAKIAELRGEK
jgi:hypothetical protein